jgi:three-Cys-motif partner protein
VIQSDANQALQSAIKWNEWHSTRGVLFLDPYGMDVEWDTLRAIANTRRVDVWFLFSLSGLYRQATRDEAIAELDRGEVATPEQVRAAFAAFRAA